MNWISIKDRLPDDRIQVLIYNGERCSVSSYLPEYFNTFGFHQWSHWDEEFDYDNISHWMSLPAPPQDEKCQKTNSDIVLHSFECDCADCLIKWKKVENDRR